MKFIIPIILFALAGTVRADNVLQGHASNAVTPGVDGGTVSGGQSNIVTDNFGTISGGFQNRAGDNAGAVNSAPFASVAGGQANVAGSAHATVGGGRQNTINNSFSSYIGSGYLNVIINANYGTIFGGVRNEVGAARSVVGGGALNLNYAPYSYVGGGRANTIFNGLLYGTISGGRDNVVSNSTATVSGGEGNMAIGFSSTIAGGSSNLAEGDHATISGGADNEASGNYAVVSGGEFNTAGGHAATVPGGSHNQANGDYSWAGGFNAVNNSHGAFLWNDATGHPLPLGTPFPTLGDNSFNVHCSGGAQFITTTNVAAASGVVLNPGGNSWAFLSDRNIKENIKPIDARAVLAKLSRLPISEWNLKSQDSSIRHVGPMAQDFHAAFGLGSDIRRIVTSDAIGIGLSAAKGLQEMILETKAEIKNQDAIFTAQQQAIDAIEKRLEALEKAAVPSGKKREAGAGAR